MAVKHLFFLAVVIGFASAQTQDSLLPKNLTLPPELENNLKPEQIEDIQNKSIDAIRKKCQQNGGPDAFSRAENAKTEFVTCLQSLVNTTALQQEIETAKPLGTVDEVFKKYCAKKPQATGCFKAMEEAVKPCFAEGERKNLKTVHNVTEQLLEFICYKDGDRIALFIAEDGQECFELKRTELEDCANKTMGTDNNFNVDSFASGDVQVPMLSFDENQCGKISMMQECAVKVLETCDKPTSANIVESLFKFIRKVTPCKAFMEQKTKPNSAYGVPVTASTIAMGILTAIFL